jgi:hypothetical protein
LKKQNIFKVIDFLKTFIEKNNIISMDALNAFLRINYPDFKVSDTFYNGKHTFTFRVVQVDILNGFHTNFDEFISYHKKDLKKDNPFSFIWYYYNLFDKCIKDVEMNVWGIKHALA